MFRQSFLFKLLCRWIRSQTFINQEIAWYTMYITFLLTFGRSYTFKLWKLFRILNERGHWKNCSSNGTIVKFQSSIAIRVDNIPKSVPCFFIHSGKISMEFLVCKHERNNYLTQWSYLENIFILTRK